MLVRQICHKNVFKTFLKHFPVNGLYNKDLPQNISKIFRAQMFSIKTFSNEIFQEKIFALETFLKHLYKNFTNILQTF